MASAAEAELGAIFYNAKDGAMLRTILEDLGHPQSATPIQTDNMCASKAVDMRFYWVKDRVKNGEFMVYWRKGSENDADYFTKHHSPSHHRLLCPRFLHVESPGKPPVSGEGVLMSVPRAGRHLSAGQPRDI
jgi:hypothetical protein